MRSHCNVPQSNRATRVRGEVIALLGKVCRMRPDVARKNLARCGREANVINYHFGNDLNLLGSLSCALKQGAY